MTRIGFAVLSLCFVPVLFSAPTASLSLGTSATVPGGAVSIPINLSGGANPAGVQWTLAYPANDIVSAAVSTGPASTAAGKTANCANSTGKTICVVIGLNQTGINDGIVASLNVQLSAAASPGGIPISMTGVVITSPDAIGMPATGNGTTVAVISDAIAVSILTCTPSGLNFVCTVTLNRAAGSGGVTVSLAKSNTNVTVPVSVTVPAGAVSATFIATSTNSSLDQVATITATLGFSMKTTTITFSAPAQVSAVACNSAFVSPGKAVACTVTLTKPAPAGGSVVSLLSSAPTVFSVPNSLTISAGASTGSFNVTVPASAWSQSVTLSATLGTVTTSTSLSITAPAQIVSFSCAPATVAPGTSSNCIVSFAAAAPAGGITVLLSGASAAVSIPSALVIPAGAVSGHFTATTTVSAPAQTILFSAVLGTAIKTASLTISAAPQLGALTCAPSSVMAGAQFTCTVTITTAAPASGVPVAISSSSPVPALPATVQVGAGAKTVEFTVTAPSVSSQQTARITAAYGVSSATASVSFTPAPLFVLHGNATELIGTSSGSAVNASYPSDLKGRVTVRGSGYLALVPITNGNGLTFKIGGPQNSSTAFITFSGQEIGRMFQRSGEILFSLKSAYSFTERKARSSVNSAVVFDVFDDTKRMYYFSVDAYGGRMVFAYNTGSRIYEYYLPAGQEDAIFGKNVIVHVRLVWNGNSATLFLNGTAVQTNTYIANTPNWTDLSSFTIGAQDVHVKTGGWYSFDDAVSDLEVR